MIEELRFSPRVPYQIYETPNDAQWIVTCTPWIVLGSVMFLRFLFLYIMLIQDNRYTGIPVYDVMYICIYTCMDAQDEYDVYSTKYDKTLDSFGHREQLAS